MGALESVDAGLYTNRELVSMYAGDPMLENLRLQLECPVCMQFMKAPITQCLEGHSVCCDCRKKLQRCPECRCDFSTTRCRRLEIISGLVSALVPDAAADPSAPALDAHRDAQSSQTSLRAECRVCNWRIPRRNLVTHVRRFHSRRHILGHLQLASIESPNCFYLFEKDSFLMWIQKTEDRESAYLHVYPV